LIAINNKSLGLINAFLLLFYFQRVTRKSNGYFVVLLLTQLTIFEKIEIIGLKNGCF